MDQEQSTRSIVLATIVERLPMSPGVYLMKDAQGKVVYVGKARQLRARVRSYFQRSSDERKFIPLLERTVADIETMVTQTEKEALLLENILIKRYKPRFNVKLVDDKNYLVLRLDLNKDYPRLEVVRTIKQDGAHYFGPYHSAGACRQTLDIVNRHFRLRTCTDAIMKQRTRPCLQYQIKRCDAPCVFPVKKEQYAEQVQDVALFLQKKDDVLVKRLKERMVQAASELNFETAAVLRNQLYSLEKTLESQSIVSSKFTDQDVFGFFRHADELTISVLHVRLGKMMEQKSYHFRDQEFPDDEAISSFVGLYYDAGNIVPTEILLPLVIEDQKAKEEWLKEKRRETVPEASSTVHVLSPQRGKKHQLVVLAHKNAAAAYQSRRHQHRSTEESLQKLQHRLHLGRLPRRIECFDISHWQGTHTVASQVVFLDGEPAKKEYRTYRITSSTQDDFASMYEVISRRLHRLKETHTEVSIRDSKDIPDLIVIDGGKGQLQSALAAMKDAGMDPSWFDMIGLAKERDDVEGKRHPDRVFLPRTKDPIRLRQNTVELFVLSRIRDEAHRFAVTFQKKQRSKHTIATSLSRIPGIGPKRQKALLQAFGSVAQLKNASVEVISSVMGMNEALAVTVLQCLGSASMSFETQGSAEDQIENAAERELQGFEQEERIKPEGGRSIGEFDIESK